MAAHGSGKDLRFREGIFIFARASGNVSISSMGSAGTPLSDEDFASRLEIGLTALYGGDSVDVTGSRAAGFNIALVGALDGTDVSGLDYVTPS